MAKIPSYPSAGVSSDYSMYHKMGSDKIIIRKKGGPSRQQVLELPGMEQVRQYNAEFSARAKAAGWVLAALGPLKGVADFSLAGKLNQLLADIQKQDGISPLGRRNIRISHFASILEGFQLNRKHTLESLVSARLVPVIVPEQNRIVLEVPALKTGVNFFTQGLHFPFFSLLLLAGRVPDYLYLPDQGRYAPADSFPGTGLQVSATPWLPVAGPLPPTLLQLETDLSSTGGEQSLMLSIGIRFGRPETAGSIIPVKYFGAGKICRVIGS